MSPFPLILLCLPNREECPPPLNPLERNPGSSLDFSTFRMFVLWFTRNRCTLIFPMHDLPLLVKLFLMTDIKIKSSPHSSLTRKISPRYSSSSHLISVLNLLSTFSKISQQWKFSQREITFRSKISGGVAFIFFAVFGGPLPSLPHF